MTSELLNAEMAGQDQSSPQTAALPNDEKIQEDQPEVKPVSSKRVTTSEEPLGLDKSIKRHASNSVSSVVSAPCSQRPSFSQGQSLALLSLPPFDEAIEVDQVDFDPTLGSDSDSITTTFDSSVENFIYENDRRYHGYRQGRYYYPNDEAEADREDMKHHATRLLLGGRLHTANFRAEPHRALDVGTGTGIWAIDFADEYPGCGVVAVDLSPIQPKLVPPNLEFQIDDVEDEWTFSEETFDFIHVRYMGSSIRKWPELLTQARRALKPGGVIELVEIDLHYTSDDGTVKDGNRLNGFIEDMARAASMIKCDLLVASKFETMLADAGFADISPQVYKLPMGRWPRDRRLKEIGLFHREQFLGGIEGIAMGLCTRILKWTREQVHVYLADVRRDIVDPKIHGYFGTYFVTAVKR